MYRALTAIVAMVLVQGCTSWKTVPLEPYALRSGGETVRADLDSGERVTLSDAAIVRDSVISPNRRIPLKRIHRLQARRVDGAATTGLIIGTTAVMAVVALAVIMSDINADVGNLGGPINSGSMMPAPRP